MWLFLPCGFFSIVQADKPGKVMVRARVREHLVALQKKYPAWIGRYKIRESQDTDYRYRLIVEQTLWEGVAALAACDIDYSNFKAEAEKVQGRGSRYVNALHDVWSVMAELQEPAGQ